MIHIKYSGTCRIGFMLHCIYAQTDVILAYM